MYLRLKKDNSYIFGSISLKTTLALYSEVQCTGDPVFGRRLLRAFYNGSLCLTGYKTRDNQFTNFRDSSITSRAFYYTPVIGENDEEEMA